MKFALQNQTIVHQMGQCLIAILLLSACAVTPTMKTESVQLVPQLPEATKSEVFEFNSKNEVIRTAQGVEVQIAYESDVLYDILREPGLTFKLEGFPDRQTSGQGRFYVFGRYVSVERVWEHRHHEPRLKLVFEPSSPEMPKMAWEDAIKLVLEEVKKQGIGFNGYTAAGNENDDSIAIYFELPEEGLYLSARVDRLFGKVNIEVFDVRDKFWTGSELSWIRDLGRSKSHISGTNHEFLALVDQPLVRCMRQADLELHIIRNARGKTTVNGQERVGFEDPTRAARCVMDILDDHPKGAFEFKISSEFTRTYVSENHDGEYLGQVLPQNWIPLILSVHFKTDDRDLRQEKRRRIRHSWVSLIDCAKLFEDREFQTSVRFTILPSGDVELHEGRLETPANLCFREVVNSWKFSPLKHGVDEFIDFKNQSPSKEF